MAGAEARWEIACWISLPKSARTTVEGGVQEGTRIRMIGGQIEAAPAETASQQMSTEPINSTVTNGQEALPQPQSVEMQTAEPLSNASTGTADRAVTIEEYKEENEKLNKYVDEVSKDLESNYRKAFDAIEKQFNQIFDKINQFEDSLKEVLNAPQTATA